MYWQRYIRLSVNRFIKLEFNSKQRNLSPSLIARPSLSQYFIVHPSLAPSSSLIVHASLILYLSFTHPLPHTLPPIRPSPNPLSFTHFSPYPPSLTAHPAGKGEVSLRAHPLFIQSLIVHPSLTSSSSLRTHSLFI